MRQLQVMKAGYYINIITWYDSHYSLGLVSSPVVVALIEVALIRSHQNIHSHSYPLSPIPMADESPKPETFELNNGSMQVLLSNLGCTIISLSVPGKDGPFPFHFHFHSVLFADLWHALPVFSRIVIRHRSWPRICWILSGPILAILFVKFGR